MKDLYKKLLSLYGPQNWWPVDKKYHAMHGTDPREEVIIGAILTQNTSWKNVEKALERLKNYGKLSLDFILECPTEKLEDLIKPAGFYRQKAKRLKAVARALHPLERIKRITREELLRIDGVGPETADVILLYAFDVESFVVDKYTIRFMERFYGIRKNYHQMKALFEESLEKDLTVYKEFHALIDEHAKRYCKKAPLCEECPVNSWCLSAVPSFQEVSFSRSREEAP
ncbi:DNA-3-methyladenine glycosylase III [Thermocrinis minervae]|uniref:DNA-3-methyladenine glycosylase III n=1 Tax=Thermocrinis minervae TaxID=381751 RepID=A0A1M6TFK5_9AQUI|nr:DNA-3-methyladenine glycosylase III [Thermocrinis minervae]